MSETLEEAVKKAKCQKDESRGKYFAQALKELCCRCLGQSVPFELVQLHPQRVPEELQMRIAYWSFPLEETRLLEYAKFARSLEHSQDRPDTSNLEVVNMVQIGMYLSATARSKMHKRSSRRTESSSEVYSVAVQFDRGCITSTKCTCSDGKWCEHVIAVCIARIRRSVPFEVHPPLSETLSLFTRDQLQKVVQHMAEIIAHDKVAKLQEIVSQIKDPESEMSKQQGAPDLTSGACVDEMAVWQVENEALRRDLDAVFSSLQHQDVRANMWSATGSVTLSIAEKLLLNHDANIMAVFEWAHSKFMIHSVNIHGHSKWRKSLPTSVTNATGQCCKALLHTLEVFFVDPFFPKSFKDTVKIIIRKIVTTNDSCSKLNTALEVAEEDPNPTLDYFLSTLTAFQSCNYSDDKPRLVATKFHSMVSVMLYWKLHGKLDSNDVQEALLGLCDAVLPTTLPDEHATHQLRILHHPLSGIPLQEIVGHSLFLLSSLSRANWTKKRSTALGFVLRLILHSTIELTHLCVSKNLESCKSLHDKILDTAKPFMKDCLEGLEEEVRGMFLKVLKDVLSRECQQEVLCWPWGVLKLAILTGDSELIQVTDTIVQHLISNPSLLLSPETAAAPKSERSKLLQVVGDSLACVLAMLFKVLPLDSSQALFVTLNNAFPRPCDYLLSFALRQKVTLSTHAKSMLDAIMPDGSVVYEDRTVFSHSVLPNLQNEEAKQWLLGMADLTPDVILSKSDAEILQVCKTALSVASHHRHFMDELQMHTPNAMSWISIDSQGDIISILLKFQLHLLHLCVCQCENIGWAQSSMLPHVRESDYLQRLFSEIPQAQQSTALEFLKANWMYCTSPQAVLELLLGGKSHKLVPSSGKIATQIAIHALDTISKLKPLQCSLEIIKKTVSFVAVEGDTESLVSLIDSLQCVIVSGKSGKSSSNKQCKLLVFLSTVTAKKYVQIKRLSENSPLLQSLMDRWVLLLTRLLKCHVSSQTVAYNLWLDSSELAVITCDAGKIPDYLNVLILAHGEPVTFYLSFWQSINKLWIEYCRTTKHEGDCSILETPVFSDAILPTLDTMKTQAREIVRKWSRDFDIVNDALFDLAYVHQLFNLDAELFREFTQDLASLCDVSFRQTILDRYVLVSLTEIDTRSAKVPGPNL